MSYPTYRRTAAEATVDETTGAQRIQRRRTRGWRMPDGAVYVGRPTRWGRVDRTSGALSGVLVDGAASVDL